MPMSLLSCYLSGNLTRQHLSQVMDTHMCIMCIPTYERDCWKRLLTPMFD